MLFVPYSAAVPRDSPYPVRTSRPWDGIGKHGMTAGDRGPSRSRGTPYTSVQAALISGRDCKGVLRFPTFVYVFVQPAQAVKGCSGRIFAVDRFFALAVSGSALSSVIALTPAHS